MTESRTGNDADSGGVALEGGDETAVLNVSGALDLALAPRLRLMVERAFRLKPRVMVVDLTAVDFLASAGMAELVRADRLCAGTTQVRVVAGSRVVLRPLELTRLTDELAVYPTRTAALEA
ncbi:STAS domain-containing protein [Amycolatopsis pittospori]|uniref:STAS domain-containing protein n=1 Tax=Amycolatopsis pittospori TaxID=2749434 RepID=UPI002E283D79|nr:STAS domain-containing protein [Amycolatopsis pittospori]